MLNAIFMLVDRRKMHFVGLLEFIIIPIIDCNRAKSFKKYGRIHRNMLAQGESKVNAKPDESIREDK